MHKLVWVAMPLLLAAALLGVQWLRGRPPSRQALNAWSSLLLMLYLLATAGLGLFWVANQQLPVFDWHYLFGYGTVLLVALHLSLNFPLLWRYLSARRSHWPRARQQQPQRRRALWVMGGVLASGLAYWLGRLHGARDGHMAHSDGTARAVPLAGATGMAFVARFHALSSHARAGLMSSAPAVAWGPAPAAFKTYGGLATQALPAAGLRERSPSVGQRPEASLDVASLGAVLWHTAGITAQRGGLHLRASPSSGGLFSTELYVVAHDVEGLPPGVWHYDARAHAVTRLSHAPHAPSVFGTNAHSGQAAVAHVVATAVFRRTGHKYRDRAYRYVLADLGHALENLRVAAVAVGATLRLLPAFDDAHVARVVQVDDVEEGVLAVAAMWPEAPALDQDGTPSPSWMPFWLPASVAASAPAALGVTSAIHHATSLRAASQSLTTPAVPASTGASRDAQANALPRPIALQVDMLALIAKRRSIRRFAARAIPLDALAAVLWQMTKPGPLLSVALRINVVLHAVQGLQEGAYRYDAAHHALQPRRAPQDLREAAGAAALDQDAIALAAAVFVISLDRSALASDPMGAARAYRHAFIEAGLMGERIYLEAGARGLGACSVGAFYDEEAAALVGIDTAKEWVVHFCAVGIPAR